MRAEVDDERGLWLGRGTSGSHSGAAPCKLPPALKCGVLNLPPAYIELHEETITPETTISAKSRPYVTNEAHSAVLLKVPCGRRIEY